MSDRLPGTMSARLPAEMAARERRRALLDISLRRAKPGTGSAPDFLRQRSWSDLGMDLRGIRTPFVIVGAVAARLYMPERATQDVDLLVRGVDAEAMGRELGGLGFALVARLSIGGTSWQTEQGERLEVIESSAAWVEDALANPARSPDGLPVIRLPYLVLMKLGAARSIDMGDLARMLGLAEHTDLDDIRAVVALYQPEDVEDLESLIYLGTLEMRDARDAR